jgi:hypothetical protein
MNCQLMSLNRVNIQLMRSDMRVKKMMILELVMILHQAGTNFQHHIELERAQCLFLSIHL